MGSIVMTLNVVQIRRWHFIGVAIVVVAALLLAPAISLLLWPIYPVSADQRRQAFHRIIQQIRVHTGESLSPRDNPKLSRWSWRVLLAQENGNVPRRDTEVDWSASWESLNGSVFEGCGDKIYCRSDSSTFVVAINGPDTAYELGLQNLDTFPKSLILFIETANSEYSWMSPVDCGIDELSRNSAARPGSEFGAGFHVAFADGAVWYLKRRIPLTTLRRFLSRADAAGVDRDAVLGDYALLRDND